MIIECINCGKKFQVNSDLIPSKGRTIQCGSCNHVWFFVNNRETTNLDVNKDNFSSKKKIKKKSDSNTDSSTKEITDIKKKREYDLIKYQKKTNLTFGKFLSYILVLIITFVALIIIIDTFKKPLYEIFPNLEFLLFNLFETLTDISLFIKDLI
tara:strand:- start:57 stop:518 length:462 start_codon:yes stop_codon:yes gene_type:complete